MQPLLQLDEVHTYLGPFHILQGVSLAVPENQATVLLGRNGAGKTTTLRTIMGLVRCSRGRILFCGEDIAGLEPHAVARRGVGYVPEDQGVFPDLTVEENIRVAIRGPEAEAADRVAFVLDLFPDLKAAWKRKGSWLSGGQRQMLSIARACVSPQTLLLIDEPSKGLAPVVVDKLAASLRELKRRTTILLVEQNFSLAAAVGDRFVVVDAGRSVMDGKMQELLENDLRRESLLGVRL
jgi:branched-chain amino acid transport system ATP-binding protein